MRQGLAMWFAGLPGIIGASLAILPSQIRLADRPPPIPTGLVVALAILQSAVVLGLAVWAGVALASKVGLRAPVFEAAASGGGIISALQPQLLPGLLGGAAGGALLLWFDRVKPPALAQLAETLNVGLPVRVLYGGVTEEILMRWGFMSLLIWAMWLLAERQTGGPSPWTISIGIIVSALLFGVAHLPLVAGFGGGLSGEIVVLVVGANAAFGVVAGLLFWRYGLESAIVAHALSHVVWWFGTRVGLGGP